MSTIENIIGNLLLRHSCVVIPSFGGFISKHESAKVDLDKGIITPPSKSLLFNRQLINNDGLLISELAKEEGISYDEALTSVQGLVNNWNNQLKAGERITIDKVGFLFFDHEKNICFEQDRFFNLLLDAYGLGKVDFIPEEKVVEPKPSIVPLSKQEGVVSEATEQVEEVSSIMPPQEFFAPKKSYKKVWKYAAAACLLPIVFYSVWIPMKTDVLESGVISIQDFNPFHKSSSSIYEMNEIDTSVDKSERIVTLDEQIESLDKEVYTYQYNFSEDFFIPVKVKSEEAPIESKVLSEQTPVNNGRYDYIVGCFSQAENASNLISDLKSQGFNAYEVDVKGGLHRVSAGNGVSTSDLSNVINAVKSIGLKGWVLKK